MALARFFGFGSSASSSTKMCRLRFPRTQGPVGAGLRGFGGFRVGSASPGSLSMWLLAPIDQKKSPRHVPSAHSCQMKTIWSQSGW